MASEEVWSRLRFFDKREFRHPELMDRDFLLFLDAVREEAMVPFIVRSDARTAEENTRAKGSATRSAHLLGRAVDIDVKQDDFRTITKMASAALEVATRWARVRNLGIEIVNEAHDSHVHIDLGGTFPDGFVIARPKIILARD